MSWPRGIEILLSYGANVNVTDNQRWYPLDHAIHRVCPESAALFAKTDCELRPAVRNQPQSTLGRAIYEAASQPTDQAKISIAKSVIIIAANQRRKLTALLSHYLPKNPICAHLSFEDQLLDVYAFDAVTALKQHGVSIPISLKFNEYRGTIYHYDDLIRELLDSLWEAGFRDLNEPDHNGATPLMLLESYDGGWAKQVNWFLDKGVNPNQQIQQIHQNSYWTCNSEARCCPCLKSGHIVMHFLAFNLSRLEWPNIEREIQALDVVDPRLKTMLQDIFNNEIRDACKCACSSAGCRAINIIVKERSFSSTDPQKLFQTAIRPISILIAKANDFISQTTFTEIIRTLTFNALGLTHTCCRANRNHWFDELRLIPFEDEDDISEIHDEEREDLQLLEDLLLEFEQRRRDKPSSFQNFIKIYWLTRMREVLSERNLPEVLSEEESLDEVFEKESSNEVSNENSLNVSSDEELLNEASDVESIDSAVLPDTGADFDDTSSHHSH